MSEVKVVMVTMEQLTKQLKVAIDAGDFKAVGQLAKRVAQLQAGEEKIAVEKRQRALAELTGKVMKAITKTIAGFAEELEKAGADGVWFSQDNVEKLTDCRLIKRKVRVAGAGTGGGGKRYSVSTNELLEKYGSNDSGDGVSFKDKWEATTDKNERYQIRVKLIKLAGVTE